MRTLNTRNLERLVATRKPFKCTGTLPETQKLMEALPPALTFVDYSGEGNEVTLTYYPCPGRTND